MSKWIDFSVAEKEAMIQRVVEERNIDEVSAEKDWWVTAILYALFSTSISQYLLFKGGTSLSKGWNIINRFSEDIDLAIDRKYFLEVRNESCATCRSNTQIHHFREKGHDFILGDFKEELKSMLQNMGLQEAMVIGENEQVDENGNLVIIDHDKDPSVIFVKYPSLYANYQTYVLPIVKIEISVLSMSEPFELKSISSLIHQTYKMANITVDDDYTLDIKTVSPARTFLEKAFLLCEEFQRNSPRTRRMTRHFYDLERLMRTEYAEKALTDIELYKSIVAHREKFYHVGYVDYKKELPEAITILPPESLATRYESDYKDMQRSFIYADSLPYKELMARISELQQRFRSIVLNTK
jgi:hypothetical protein